jgi:hypothetical protein
LQGCGANPGAIAGITNLRDTFGRFRVTLVAVETFLARVVFAGQILKANVEF